MELFLSFGLYVLGLTWILSAVTRVRSRSAITKSSDAALPVCEPRAESAEKSGRYAEPGTEPAASRASLGHRLIWAFAVTSIVVGLAFRLYGFERSLWLDEFGTLWTIEGSLAQTFHRTLEFQGQSPFYYLIVWPFAHGLGESEISLRLPSLLCGLGAVFVLYRLGVVTGGKDAGLICAALSSLSFSLVESSAMARPYAPAVFMTAVMLLGFAEVTLQGRARGRLLFSLGGAGLVSAHYMLGLIMLGVGVGYFGFAELRRHYSVRQFFLDAALQVLLVLAWLPHLGALWSRRGQLQWLAGTNYGLFMDLIGPFVVLAGAGLIAGRSSSGRKSKAFEAVLWLAIAAHVGFLSLLAALGTNLLHWRYLIVIIVPAIVLAANGIRKVRAPLAVLPWGYWLLATTIFFIAAYSESGSFSRAGNQDWRQAAEILDRLIDGRSNVPVLYRSGFVEDDLRTEGVDTPAAFTPLRTPGGRPPAWEITPLTYSWSTSGREDYFERRVTPEIANAPAFFYLSCACTTPLTGDYPTLLEQWLRERFPGKFSAERLKAGRGIVLIRFETQQPDAAESRALPGLAPPGYMKATE